MSLFSYKLAVIGGEPKSGRITAKTEKAARERLLRENPGSTVQSLKEEAVKTPVVTAAKKGKPSSKLGSMLYLQSGRCFFCGEELRVEDASIEHLQPLSLGGTRTPDNEVICHTSLNATFGNMELKRKIEFVLRQAGKFKCPKF